MTDEAVGKLWRKLNSDCSAKGKCGNHGDYYALIDKLVAEREEYNLLCCKHANHHECNHRDEALWEFGIEK